MLRYVVPSDYDYSVPVKQEEIRSPFVFMANSLVERKNTFSALETKIFYLGLTQIRPKLLQAKYYDEHLPKSVIPTKEIVNMLGGHNKYYSDMKKALVTIKSKNLIVQDGDVKSESVEPIFSDLTWAKPTGLTMKFAEGMQPYLLDFTHGSYTRIEYEQIMKLSSIYAIRIFELCMQYRCIGERTITVEELRYFLGVPLGAYKDRMDNFKKAVIKLPIAEINKKTNFNITCNYKKKGRNIVSVNFRLTRKDNTEKVNGDAVISYLINLGVDKPTADELVQKHGAVYCQKNAEFMKMKFDEMKKKLVDRIVKAILTDEYGQHKKKLDKEVMELWPTLDEEDIIALNKMANKDDERAQRRLYLHYCQTEKQI